VKLCRFEHTSSPGKHRSGIFYGGKVYETDGAKAVGVHESSDVRLLTPIGQPPSVRFFWCYDAPPVAGAGLAAQLDFVYLNPATLLPPVGVVKKPSYAGAMSFDACVAMVVAAPGAGIPPESAEEHLLGFTLATSFADEHLEVAPMGVPRYSARRRDMGTAIGPAITTPDELDEAVIEVDSGRRFRLELSARVNGSEVCTWDLADLPVTLAEVVSLASESCALQSGDLLCVALPMRAGGRPLPDLDRGDEVQLTCDRLGSLTTVVA
jgi:2-keto-4-pentenoate hydratase/2-oxohepta-3-ene-1,7-dioic acid hydratase in catechol pathway